MLAWTCPRAWRRWACSVTGSPRSSRAPSPITATRPIHASLRRRTTRKCWPRPCRGTEASKRLDAGHVRALQPGLEFISQLAAGCCGAAPGLDAPLVVGAEAREIRAIGQLAARQGLDPLRIG